MICCGSFRAHRWYLTGSVALIVLCAAVVLLLTGCHKEKPVEEAAPAAPAAEAPAAPSAAPSGVFVHKDVASSGGHDVDFYSILRFAKDGQVCSVNVTTELDDEALSRYSKSCDAHDKGREYGKYTFVNGTITFSLGETDYSGTFNNDRLILSTVYRPTQKTSTDEYRHHDVAYDSQGQQSVPSGPQ